MNTELLLEVVEGLREELEEYRLYEPLAKLSQQLEQGPDDLVSSVRSQITDLLSQVPSNYLVPSRRAILREIGGEKLVGKGLSERLIALLDDYRLSAKEAAKVVTEISSEILSFHGFLNNLANSARSLRLEAHKIPNGKCEVGVLYPKPEVIVDLESLVREGSELDHALRTFMEVGGVSGSPRIRLLSSSDIGVYVTVVAGVGLAISKCIEKALDLVRKKAEIEKIRLEVEEKRLDLEIAQQLRRQEKKVEDAGIEEAASVVIELYEGTDEGRRNEIKIAATGAARFILVQIQRGVVFEVAASNLTTDGTSFQEAAEGQGGPAAEARQLSEIQRLGNSMRELAAGRNQLALPGIAADPDLERPSEGTA